MAHHWACPLVHRGFMVNRGSSGCRYLLSASTFFFGCEILEFVTFAFAKFV